MDEAVGRGPVKLNIKNVARRAGVAVGSLYQYFPNRDGMLDIAVERVWNALLDTLLYGLSPDQDG